MTAPAGKVTDVCGDCDGRGYVELPDSDIVGDHTMDCATCETTGFVDVPAEDHGDDQ